MATNPSTIIVNDIPLSLAPGDFVGSAIPVENVEISIGVLPEAFIEAVRPQREIGDQINRFMLCVLISKSAKRLKARAENIGVSLPMSTITRSLQQAYQLAAKDENGPFAESKPNLAALMKLNEKVLKSEIIRQAQVVVKKR